MTPELRMSLYRSAPWRLRAAMLASGSCSWGRSALPKACEFLVFEAEPLLSVWLTLTLPCELLWPLGLLPGAAKSPPAIGCGGFGACALDGMWNLALHILIIPMAASAALVAIGLASLLAFVFFARPYRLSVSLLSAWPASRLRRLPRLAREALLAAALRDEADFARWEGRAVAAGAKSRLRTGSAAPPRRL